MRKSNKILFGSGSLLILLFGISVYTGSIANMSETKFGKKSMAVYIKNEAGNYEKGNAIPTSGYILNEEKSTCNNNAIPVWNRSKSSLKIKNLSSDNTSCYLYFDEETEVVSTVLGNLTVNRYTPDFSNVATTDEGIFKAEDNDGTSYYWRGAAATNYLRFGGYCWRIVRINGDGTIRLIYDGESCHQNGEVTEDSIAVKSIKYNTQSNKKEYVGYTYEEEQQRPTNNANETSSNLKVQTENWYNEYLVSYASNIADGKFCNDRELSNEVFKEAYQYYAARKRLETNKQPTLRCGNASDVYMLKVGAITADEVSFAGGYTGAANNLYYLYNGQYYWTISPDHWYITNAWSQVFTMYGSGQISNSPAHSGRGIRPVINLRSDVTFKSGGNGTISNPYVVEGSE